MRVRVNKEYLADVYEGYDFVSNEFDVESEDDGFWTGEPFYSGWMYEKCGHKVLVSINPEHCEVIIW